MQGDKGNSYPSQASSEGASPKVPPSVLIQSDSSLLTYEKIFPRFVLSSVSGRLVPNSFLKVIIAAVDPSGRVPAMGIGVLKLSGKNLRSWVKRWLL